MQMFSLLMSNDVISEDAAFWYILGKSDHTDDKISLESVYTNHVFQSFAFFVVTPQDIHYATNK